MTKRRPTCYLLSKRLFDEARHFPLQFQSRTDAIVDAEACK